MLPASASFNCLPTASTLTAFPGAPSAVQCPTKAWLGSSAREEKLPMLTTIATMMATHDARVTLFVCMLPAPLAYESAVVANAAEPDGASDQRDACRHTDPELDRSQQCIAVEQGECDAFVWIRIGHVLEVLRVQHELRTGEDAQQGPQDHMRPYPLCRETERAHHTEQSDKQACNERNGDTPQEWLATSPSRAEHQPADRRKSPQRIQRNEAQQGPKNLQRMCVAQQAPDADAMRGQEERADQK